MCFIYILISELDIISDLEMGLYSLTWKTSKTRGSRLNYVPPQIHMLKPKSPM